MLEIPWGGPEEWAAGTPKWSNQRTPWWYLIFVSLRETIYISEGTQDNFQLPTTHKVTIITREVHTRLHSLDTIIHASSNPSSYQPHLVWSMPITAANNGYLSFITHGFQSWKQNHIHLRRFHSNLQIVCACLGRSERSWSWSWCPKVGRNRENWREVINSRGRETTYWGWWGAFQVVTLIIQYTRYRGSMWALTTWHMESINDEEFLRLLLCHEIRAIIVRIHFQRGITPPLLLWTNHSRFLKINLKVTNMRFAWEIEHLQLSLSTILHSEFGVRIQ